MEKLIDFVIITYNRADDLLALLKSIANLNDCDKYLNQIIIINNASTTINYDIVTEYITSNKTLDIKYHLSNENLGVAKGRNFALTFSKAKYVIMIDDDAELENADCLSNLIEEFELKNTVNEKAIVSFKVLYYDTLTLQQNTLPHKKFNEYKNKEWFETYFFAGGAHCIKRSALDKVGHYPDNFFYGMEEYDLSYRLLNNGYTIVYSNKIIMLHKESPLGRKPKVEKLKMMWLNKTIVAKKYLPIRYVYSTAFMWSLFMLQNSGFNIIEYVKGWSNVLKTIPKVKSQKISDNTIEHLKKLEARLWY